MEITDMDDQPAKFLVKRSKRVSLNGLHETTFEIVTYNQLGDEFTNNLIDLISKHLDNGDKPV